MKLNDKAVRNAKPADRGYKLADGKGLYLFVTPTGSKLWRHKYRFLKKEKLLSFGPYPELTLAEARQMRDEARRQILRGIDPGQAKRETELLILDRAANTFELVAREWLVNSSAKWVPSHTARITKRFEQDVFPSIGARAVSEVTARELLQMLRKIEARGVIETAHRIHQNCGQVFRYAIATGRAERDVATDLRGALKPIVSTHHASIADPKGVADLLRAIYGYEGAIVTRCALRLAPLVFVRPGELRHAEWTEIDFGKAEWRIPAAKMKMKAVHIVPLSTQSLAVLKTIQAVTGDGRYVFPSVRTPDRPMSENTVNAALRRLDYTTDEMTGHGFRSMASTMLNEQGWNRDAIERQLAHGERDSVRAAYNYAEHLPERRKMMQAWADYLEALARGGTVIQMRAAGAD
jgi:integrase